MTLSDTVRTRNSIRESRPRNEYNNEVLATGDNISRFHSQISLFGQSHTISVLLMLIIVLCYVAVVENSTDNSSEYNAKRGVIACFAVFMAFGVTQVKDGPFLRPHPAFWRLVVCASIIYELCLIFLLFQTATDARRWMSHIDPALGKDLPEHDYGGNCLIYDKNNTENPWHNVWDKFDAFVPAHFIGWWIKTLILRDYWMTFILSLMFEINEYSLQHQLPNFSECWWDHWFMDFILCNGGGIVFGMYTLHYLEMKKYNWRDVLDIPTYSGRLLRLVEQFTPYSWRKFNWNATVSLKRWFTVLLLIFMFSLAELNVFYMKAALWIPPTNNLIGFRLALYSLMGLVACRETYDYLNDSTCKKFGQQSWVLASIIITEALISVKFLWDVVTLPPPKHITIFWCFFLTGVFAYTCWLFLVRFLGYGRHSVISNKESNVVPEEKPSIKFD
ncbi:phosphatidylserine synthase 2-like [Hydractinia symbiolongicarpus]|uniref:phosphatidylserine synthase 2-like n=1 Tax=Hydractinia symbiolongicarpus TaxID=13093 RepID=UPI00254FAD0B|nr:phosphatidylserine synthase 2-like [Hydractinia symbiolongicarpus]